MSARRRSLWFIIAGCALWINSAYAQTLSITQIAGDNVRATFTTGGPTNIYVIVHRAGATRPANCAGVTTAASSMFLANGNGATTGKAFDTDPVTSGGSLAGTFAAPGSGATHWCFALFQVQPSNIFAHQSLCLGDCDPAPTATAAASPTSAAEGATVMLTGTGADMDVEGAVVTVTYAWTFAFAPALPAGVTIAPADASAAVTSFRVPFTLTRTHTLTATLTVTGSGGATTPATATVTLSGVPDADPQVTITAPTGGTATVNEGSTVNLTATATDVAADGTPFTALTYAWEQVDSNTATALTTATPAGNRVMLRPAAAASTSFTAPEFAADNTTVMLHFLVTVTGSGGGMDTARATITVNGDNDEPTVTAAISTARAAPGTVITLTANANDDDHSNAAITYAWSCPAMVNAGATLSAPAIMPVRAGGGDATAAHTGNAMATFTAPMLVAENDPTQTAAMITVTCTVTVVSGGDTMMDAVTVVIANPTVGEAADDAILPNVLRHQTHGIHGGIFNRIQQRQRADGRWK